MQEDNFTGRILNKTLHYRIRNVPNESIKLQRMTIEKSYPLQQPGIMLDNYNKI